MYLNIQLRLYSSHLAASLYSLKYGPFINTCPDSLLETCMDWVFRDILEENVQDIEPLKSFI